MHHSRPFQTRVGATGAHIDRTVLRAELIRGHGLDLDPDHLPAVQGINGDVLLRRRGTTLDSSGYPQLNLVGPVLLGPYDIAIITDTDERRASRALAKARTH